MPSLTPVVIEPVDIVGFIQYILDHHVAPSTLVVCCSKDAFLKQLHSATTLKASAPEDDESHQPNLEPSITEGAANSKQAPGNPWSVPSLRLLASSRTVKLAFCPEITHLRAYLATYAHREHEIPEYQTTAQPATNSRIPTLAILNLIDLHRHTSAFSAQGLNRTLAVAVEAAYRTDRRLVLAECPSERGTLPSDDVAMGDEEPGAEIAPSAYVWDEEISILNVTTKTFGAGERGWVGRTIKIRAIAGRWCRFQTLDGCEV